MENFPSTPGIASAATFTGYNSQEVANRFSPYDVFYTPTMRPPGGSCLETGTEYAGTSVNTANGDNTPVFYAFVFCNPKDPDRSPDKAIGVMQPIYHIDASFRSYYECNCFGSGLPEYYVVDWYNPSAGRDEVILYDFIYKQWDHAFYAQTTTMDPDSQGTRGWAMFETHTQTSIPQANGDSNKFGFYGESCATIPTIAATNLQWASSGSQFNPLHTISPIQYENDDYDSTQQCINSDDGSGEGAFYQLDIPYGLPNSYDDLFVISSQSQAPQQQSTSASNNANNSNRPIYYNWCVGIGYSFTGYPLRVVPVTLNMTAMAEMVVANPKIRVSVESLRLLQTNLALTRFAARELLALPPLR